MNKQQQAEDDWVAETQRFQRIAGVPETPEQTLREEFRQERAARKERNKRKP